MQIYFQTDDPASSFPCFQGGFSDNISANDPTYFEGQAKSSDKIIPIMPLMTMKIRNMLLIL